jgi:hypothetical protein
VVSDADDRDHREAVPVHQVGKRYLNEHREIGDLFDNVRLLTTPDLESPVDDVDSAPPPLRLDDEDWSIGPSGA